MNTSTTYKIFKSTKIFFAAVFVFLMVGVGSVKGATRTASVTGNWSTPATWGGTVPLAGEPVIINSGVTVTLDVNTAAIASLTINAMTAGGTNGLTVGTFTLNTGTIAIAGSATVGRFSTLSVSTGIINATGNISFTGTAAQARLTFTGAGILNLGGNLSTGGTFAASTGTVNCNGTTGQTVGGYTYNTLKSNDPGDVTLLGAATIVTLTIGDLTGNSMFSDGGFVITPSGVKVLNLISGEYDLGSATVGTAWPVWTTRNITAGTTVGYVSTVNQAVSITPSYPNLIFSGAGAKTPTAGTLTVGGNLSVTGGAAALNTNNNIVNVTGDILGTGNITQGSGLMTVAGNWTNTGTFTAGTGGVTLTGASKQITGAAGLTFTTLTVNGTYTNNNPGTLTVSTALSGTGALSNSGTLNIQSACSIGSASGGLNNSGTVAITGAGNITTLLAGFTNTGTINLNGTGTIIGITNNAAGIVNLTNSGTITSFNNATATSTLNISDLTVPAFTTLTATAAGNTVNYSGAGNQTVKATTYSNLTLSGSGTKTLAAATDVSATLTVKAGTTLSLGTNALGATTAPTSVVLENGATGSTISGTGILHLGGDVTVNYTSGAGVGATISCPINLDANRTFTVADETTAATDLTISGVIADGSTASGITKAGTGTYTLSGLNTYSGSTTVNGGTLKAGIATQAFGLTSAVTLANTAGVVLDITGYDNTIGSLTGGGSTGGNISLGSNTLTIGSDNTSPAAYAGIISGAGALTKVGTGILTLSGANTYSVGTTINVGTLSITNDGNLGAATSPVSFTGGTLLVTSTDGTNSQRVFTFNAGGGTINVATGQTYVIGNTGTSLGNLAGNNTFTFCGTWGAGYAGELILKRSTTRTSATIANGGILRIEVPDAFNPSSSTNVTINNDAVLEMGASFTIGRNMDFWGGNGVSPTVRVTGGNSVTMSAGAGYTINGSPSTLTYETTGAADALTITGIISGTGGNIVKTGSGTLTLSSVNTYTGTTTANGGTLKLGVSSALTAGGPLGTGAGGTTVASGAVLDLNGFSLTGTYTEAITLNGTGLTASPAGALTNTSSTASTLICPITLGSASTITAAGTTGTLTCSGNIGVGAYALTLDGVAGSAGTMSGVISTPTSVIKNGAGTWTFSGLDTYTGTTTINTGTLVLNNVTSFASSTTTVNSPGILELTSTNTTVDNWRLNTILAGNGTINKTGIGWIQTNTNANTFSGTFNVQVGTFGTSFLSSDWTGVTADFNVSAGALLDARGQAITVGSLNGTGNVGTTWNTVATVTTGAGNKSGTFSGIISGDGSSGINDTSNPNGSVLSLVKTGTGTQTLSGANTYSGLTTISVGTLKLGASTSVLGTTAGITSVTSGAVLDLNGFTLSTAEPLTLNGTGISNGGALINSSGTATNYNGAITLGSASSIGTTGNITLGADITGSQDLTKVGAGILNLGSSTATLGKLTISAGTLTSTSGTMTLTGDFTNNATFTHNSGTATFTGNSSAINGTATTQTFNNIVVNKTSGQTLSVGGSTTTLAVVGTFTETIGNFTAPPTMSVTGIATLTAGTFTTGTNLTLSSDWTNNGGTFTPGTGTVTFNGNNAAINGTATTQTFNNIVVNKTSGQTLSVGGSTTTLAVGGTFTETTGNFTAPTLMIVTGNSILTTGTFTAGTNLAFSGNWTNNGGTFTAGSGIVTFNGSSAQSIGGSTSTTFNDLTINNNAGVTLNAATTVSNTLTLNVGILTTTSPNLLSITNVATSAISGGSTTSFINGPAKWSLPSGLTSGSSYFFPVGSGSTYFPFTLVNPTTTGTATAQVQAFATGSGGSNGTGVSAISTTEYWQLTTTGSYTNSSISLARTTAIAPNTVVASSTTKTGSYASLVGTFDTYAVYNSNVTTNNFFVLGTGNVATMNISTNTLYGFNYSVGSGPSNEQSFNVSGNLLTGNIIVTPPASNYEISTLSGGIFQTTPITLTSVSGKVSATIYVRERSGLSLGNYASTIVVSTSNAQLSAQNINCYGNVTPAITVGGGGSYCAGSTISLTSSGTFTNQYWTGPNGFYSTLPSPVTVTTNATPAMAGTYILNASTPSGTNLVTNSDFSSGFSAFTTDYTPSAGGSSGLVPEGVYAVIASPNTQHSAFCTCGDHTGSGGLQLVVNGSSASKIIWEPSSLITVTPYTNYQFTYWVQTVDNADPAPAQTQLFVNNVAAGNYFQSISTWGVWQQFLFNWYSGASTTADLRLMNQQTAANGNDFALDDIRFEQVYTSTASVNVSVVTFAQPAIVVSASANPVNSGTSVTYTATPTNGGTAPTYQWYVGAVLQSATGTTFTDIPVNGEVVSCTMTSNTTCLNGGSSTVSSSVTMVVNTVLNYWYGTNSTDWGTASNWTAHYVPGAGDNIEFATTTNNSGNAAIKNLILDIDRPIGNLTNATTLQLIIPPARCLTVNGTISTASDPNRIYIQAYPDGTQQNGSLIFKNATSVYGTVEMYSKATITGSPGSYVYNWQYFGIPLTQIIASPTFDGSYVRDWHETGTAINNHWLSLNNSSTLNPFYGYELCQTSPKKIIFVGQLVNTNFTSGSLTISYFGVGNSSNALYPGQYVFANPYTAAIDIRYLTFGAGAQQTVYLYNTGSFAAWTGINGGTSSGESPGQYLSIPQNVAGQPGIPVQVPSMQAMLIRPVDITIPTNYYFNITYNSVIVKNTTLQRSPSINAVKSTDKVGVIVDVKAAHATDRMWIFSEPTSTFGFDNGWDGQKILGSALTPQLYSIEKDGNYQVNTVPDMNGTELAFQAGQDVEDTLTFTNMNLEKQYAGVYLVDLQENRTIDITATGTQYAFMAPSTPTPVTRFKIVTRPYKKNAPDAETQIKVFSVGSSIFVQNFGSVDGECRIYDIAGHYLMKIPFSANAVTAITNSLRPGVYIAMAIAGGEKVSKRLIVQ